MPLTLHEDAGPFLRNQSVTVISFGGMFGQGGFKMCQLPIASFMKGEGKIGPAALQSLWGPILAGFEQLARVGINGRRFLLLFGKGDLDVRSNSWGLPHFNSIRQPCSECMCDRAARPFTDMRSTAVWRSTQLTAEQFIARAETPLHPLLASRFMWRFFVRPTSCTLQIVTAWRIM